MAMLPVDEDEELETAYHIVMLESQRVAVRIARAWPTGTGKLWQPWTPAGWTTLFHLLPADKEDRAWKWKLKWAQRQLDNLKGIENDAAASHSAIGQTAASNASAGRAAAGAEAEAAAATHSAMGQAAASNAGACREAAGAEAEPPAAAHSAKGQAATASNLRWRVLTVDDTMFAPPLPQDGEAVHRVNHKRTSKEGAVPADPALHIISESRGAYITSVTWMQTRRVILSNMS